ncbi:hypothetical protein CerSpe_177820 [Prunus speciosa]
MKKGSDSIAQYLNHIKDARDQLSCVGVHFTDEDVIILALTGLPAEYNTFWCVLQCRESVLSFKEFPCPLLAEEIMIAYFGRACYGGSDDIAALANAVMPPLQHEFCHSFSFLFFFFFSTLLFQSYAWLLQA